MKAPVQFRRGLKKATKITGISERQACLRAKYNENQLNRFHRGADIMLTTLDDICVKGFGLSFDAVYRMGE